MIRAFSYFDDSGTHRDTVVTVIGGFVATKAVWVRIEPNWKAVLRDFRSKGVHCFHATDCLAQRNQFERLSKDECHYVYEQLSNILEQSDIQAVWAAVRTEDWKAVTDTNFKVFFQSAYDFCIDRVVSDLVGWSAKHGSGSPVGLVVAKQKEHETETANTFSSWAAIKRVSELVGPLTHEYPDRLIPLQAADMMAHEAYRHGTWRHRMEKKLPALPDPTHGPVLEKISRARGLRSGGYYDREFLEEFALGIRSEPA